MKTPEEISGAFAAVFKDVVPADQSKVSAAERLEPYAVEIRKLRKLGCSWRQIATGMKDPRIGLQTSPVTLKQVFGTKRERAKKPKRVPGSGRPPTTLKVLPATAPVPSR